MNRNIHKHKNMKTLLLTLLALYVVGLTGRSSAATIAVTNTSANILEDTSNNGAFTHTLSNWSLNGGNAIVVYFSGENTTNVTAQYGTEALTIVETTGFGNDHVAAIGYIINPTLSTADLDVTWVAGSNSENMITAISLENVDSVVASSSTGGNLSFNYTTAGNGGFVVGNATNNSFNFSSPPTVTSSNLDTNVFYSNISGNSSALQTYGVIDTAGSYTDTYANSVVSSGVAFEAIPEPSSFALTMVVLGGFLLRRRR